MFDWFTTIPGILVTCGVILLVIAIVLFIVGSRKTKKENNQVTNENTNMVNNTVEVAPEINPVSVQPVSITEPTVTPVAETEGIEPIPPVGEPSVNMMSEMPTMISDEMETPAEMNIPPMEPVMPNPEPTSFEVPSQNVEMSKIDEPTIIMQPVEDKPVTIYGGNDPLEATQALPKIDEHHEPYGGALGEAKLVEPNMEPFVPAPVEEVVSTMPAMEPAEEIKQPVTINEPVTPTPVVEPAASTSMPTEETKPVVEEL